MTKEKESVDAARDGAVAERSAARSEPPPLTSGEIEELARLEKAATPAPWYQTGDPWFQDGSGVLAGSPDPHVAPLIVDCESWGGEREEQQQNHPDVKMADPDDDAALITAMRNALPRLLSSLKRTPPSPAGWLPISTAPKDGRWIYLLRTITIVGNGPSKAAADLYIIRHDGCWRNSWGNSMADDYVRGLWAPLDALPLAAMYQGAEDKSRQYDIYQPRDLPIPFGNGRPLPFPPAPSQEGAAEGEGET